MGTVFYKLLTFTALRSLPQLWHREMRKDPSITPAIHLAKSKVSPNNERYSWCLRIVKTHTRALQSISAFISSAIIFSFLWKFFFMNSTVILSCFRLLQDRYNNILISVKYFLKRQKPKILSFHPKKKIRICLSRDKVLGHQAVRDMAKVGSTVGK